ncbi:hypothetical protein HK405_011311 [Cladochytrium tenue]|nr:hypothetical protein HK405_011311 [Cladochytrium tenue]
MKRDHRHGGDGSGGAKSGRVAYEVPPGGRSLVAASSSDRDLGHLRGRGRSHQYKGRPVPDHHDRHVAAKLRHGGNHNYNRDSRSHHYLNRFPHHRHDNHAHTDSHQHHRHHQHASVRGGRQQLELLAPFPRNRSGNESAREGNRLRRHDSFESTPVSHISEDNSHQGSMLPSAHPHPHPWLTHIRVAAPMPGSGSVDDCCPLWLERLAAEITAFADYAAPTPAESRARDAAAALIAAVAERATRSAAGRPAASARGGRNQGRPVFAHESAAISPCDAFRYGSSGSGLLLPWSDVDMVLVNADEVRALRSGDVSSQRSPMLPLPLTDDRESKKARRERQIALLKAVRTGLYRARVASGPVQLVPSARIPILKFECREFGRLAFDVSCGQAGGLRAVRAVRAWAARVPPLRPLVLVLKQFLRVRGLGEPAAGGVGGYACVLWVLAFLCICTDPAHAAERAALATARAAAGLPPAAATTLLESTVAAPPGDAVRVHLGAALVDFFLYFGRVFDYRARGIVFVRDEGAPPSDAACCFGTNDDDGGAASATADLADGRAATLDLTRLPLRAVITDKPAVPEGGSGPAMLDLLDPIADEERSVAKSAVRMAEVAAAFTAAVDNLARLGGGSAGASLASSRRMKGDTPPPPLPPSVLGLVVSVDAESEAHRAAVRASGNGGGSHAAASTRSADLSGLVFPRPAALRTEAELQLRSAKALPLLVSGVQICDDGASSGEEDYDDGDDEGGRGSDVEVGAAPVSGLVGEAEGEVPTIYFLSPPRPPASSHGALAARHDSGGGGGGQKRERDGNCSDGGEQRRPEKRRRKQRVGTSAAPVVAAVVR